MHPVSVAHTETVRIELSEKVVFSLVVKQTVRVVHKAVHGGDMSQGPSGFLVQGLLVFQGVGNFQQINAALVSPFQTKLQLLPLVTVQKETAPGPGRRIQDQLVFFQKLPVAVDPQVLGLLHRQEPPA